VKAGKLKVWFTHLNHSNPAYEPAGAARKTIEGRGFRVVGENMHLFPGLTPPG
jgi:hypothetical protein